ncbi:MAG: PVC-type heme-binding CxxCH protein, partial [Pirellulaceae bacterium]
MRRVVMLCGMLSFLVPLGDLAQGQEPEPQLQEDYAEDLPRIPPTSPQDALRTFDLLPGLKLEQVASEPNVVDPVALDFDEYGRMYVVEMRGYSEDAELNIGRIRRLEDTTGDGKYDKSEVFLDGLSWPTAVVCTGGGILIGASPDILFAKDTTGDGKADQTEVVFSGFNRSNVQGLLNSFQWGLDNRIHGATSSSGGTVQSTRHPSREAVRLNRRDFVIEPRSMLLSPASGGGQHGMSFDNFGRRYVSSNSDHIQLVMFEDRYIARNPYLAAPSPTKSIASDGPAATVYRTSPVEPWRIIRTRLRAQGLVPGVVEGGGKPAGYFTGATGVTIYRGDALPPKYHGNAFVSDAGGNLVHRKTLTPKGVEVVADRADPGREFLSSADIWFRPVQMANSPDGSLLVIDMSREVIEHPHSLPPMIKKHLDLTSGRDRGRIYRVVPEGFQQPADRAIGDATINRLVELLANPNGWHRQTAARLIYERQDQSALPLLKEMAHTGKIPEARVRALYGLSGLEGLTPEVLLVALADNHPAVREHAIRLSEPLLGSSPELAERLAEMVADEAPLVRYQLAYTLGELPPEQRAHPLAQLIANSGDDPWLQLAVQSSLGEGASEVLAILLKSPLYRGQPSASPFMAKLARQVAAEATPEQLQPLVQTLAKLPDTESHLTSQLVRGLIEGAGSKREPLRQQLATAKGGDGSSLLARVQATGIRQATDENLSETQRRAGVGLLALVPWNQVKEDLSSLLDYRQPQSIQLEALATLSRFDEPEVVLVVTDRFPEMPPKLRGESLELILSRPQWVGQLLNAIETENFAATDLDAARIERLRNHPDKSLAAKAEKLLASLELGRRADVVAMYQEALKLEGDVDRGRAAFRKTCSACHRLEDFGSEIGKNLKGVAEKGPEALLVAILDPNREIDPLYLNYIAVTDDGRTLTGMLAAETATSITLKRAENATDVILRGEIDQMRATGLSLMPEGLERELDPQA